MAETPEDIARAVSTHDFERAIPHFAQDIVWRPLGGEVIAGREAVTRTCHQLAAELEGVDVRLQTVRVITGGSTVVVETVATYTDLEGERTAVASCDVYDFDDETLTGIASYNVEVPPDSRAPPRPDADPPSGW